MNLINSRNGIPCFLTNSRNSYLLKDILELDKIRNSKTLLKLLWLLAFQVGSEVSLTELSQKIGLDYKTVARYIDGKIFYFIFASGIFS